MTEQLSNLESRRNVLKADIEKFATEKFRSSGFGITFHDVQKKYTVNKKQAQRTLKYFRETKNLFTAKDLIDQGINLVENKKPQQFFPAYEKAEILEKLKKRKCTHNVLEFQTLCNSDHLEKKKAQTLLDVLLLLPYYPIFIHKLQLIFRINRDRIKEAKSHEEIIGQRHIRYTLSANGTVQIAVRSNNTPFRLESELDVSLLFAFLGQVKDRLLYLLGDIKELVIPPVSEWTLIQCDVNKDIEIDAGAQLTIPDIQLKYADRVFREYMKVKQGRAYCRVEESLKLNEILPVALDRIRSPYASLEKRIEDLERKDDPQPVNMKLETGVGSRPEIAGKQSCEKGADS